MHFSLVYTSKINFSSKKRLTARLVFLYNRISLVLLKEGFLGVAKSEKPECTRGTRGFRGQVQREKHPLKD